MITSFSCEKTCFTLVRIFNCRIKVNQVTNESSVMQVGSQPSCLHWKSINQSIKIYFPTNCKLVYSSWKITICYCIRLYRWTKNQGSLIVDESKVNMRGISDAEENIISNIDVDGGWYPNYIQTIYNILWLRQFRKKLWRPLQWM